MDIFPNMVLGSAEMLARSAGNLAWSASEYGVHGLYTVFKDWRTK
jgi:hypothetical protein